jgi:acyl-coenzyme A synthetase/AMP-(fatty) acid ligase
MKMLQTSLETKPNILADLVGLSSCLFSDASSSVDLNKFEERVVLNCDENGLYGRSVLLRTRSQISTAMALITLDGLVRRIVICPPDLSSEHIPYVLDTAEVDAGVTDEESLLSDLPKHMPRCAGFTTASRPYHLVRGYETEWVLLTSGTTGIPKLVVHTLASLTGAIESNFGANRRAVWSTLYDIRRFGGLQILLRAVLTGSSMVASDARESMSEFFARAARSGVTHISGTPSQWRHALISPSARLISPDYVRLSGEVVDRTILNHLHSMYPQARLVHAFASTEAGVAFEVRDSEPGFPLEVINGKAGVEMKIVENTLRVRSKRTATCYLGKNPPELRDAEGFVDTGDMVDLRDGRYYFAGRRDHVINVGGLKVHPEEVEAVLNRHPKVSISLVKTKRSRITGALVVADVVTKALPRPDGDDLNALECEILEFCRGELARHKVPVAINFVPDLAVAESGKLVRPFA